MKKIYVCYASSNEYAGFTGISILSLLMNNTNFPFEKIFILDYGIDNENKEKLNAVVEKFGLSIDYINAGVILEELRETLGIKDFSGSLATYSRAFISYIVPDEVRYLLYIDSDTIVCNSISPILSFEMNEYAMAGVIGVNQYPYPDESCNKELALISGNKKYTACGIVFYDLENWRKHHCIEMIIDCCKTGREFPLADQTLINNAIPERLLGNLPGEFNYWGHCYPVHREFKEYKRGGWYSDSVVKHIIEHPIIIHYKGLLYRPWFDGCFSRLKDEYIKYKSISPWADMPQGSLRKEISKKNGKQKLHMFFEIAYSKVPYEWMAKCVIGFKRLITKLK